MKKTIVVILIIIIFSFILFLSWYNKNIQIINEIKKFNSEYDFFLNKDITGVELTTIINKSLENNNKYNIKKDKNGIFVDDGKYSIEILIKPIKDRKDISYGSF